MIAKSIELIWDDESGNDRWFVRIRRDDGQEIDSLPPQSSSWPWTDRGILDEDAYNIIAESLAWEGVEAEDALINDAVKCAIKGPK